MTLIDNWKKCWKLASFQLSMLIISLEAANIMLESMPEEYATYIRPALVFLLPVARLVKQTKVS